MQACSAPTPAPGCGRPSIAASVVTDDEDDELTAELQAGGRSLQGAEASLDGEGKLWAKRQACSNVSA